MKTKALIFKIVKICVDAAMTVLFLLLMGYHLIDGAAHEWLGIALFVLFIAHNILNYKWYAVLFKGKYGAVRIVQTVINFLLLIAMLGCIISAMCVSMHVFDWMDIRAAAFGRKLHLMATIWAFILMALHFGLHWSYFANKAKKLVKPSEKAAVVLKWVFRAMLLAICVYGFYNFVIRKMWEEMFLLTEFKWYDYDKNVVLYFVESLTIMIVFASISYYVKKLLNLSKTKKVADKASEKGVKHE